jgi:hypothetical protein
MISLGIQQLGFWASYPQPAVSYIDPRLWQD